MITVWQRSTPTLASVGSGLSHAHVWALLVPADAFYNRRAVHDGKRPQAIARTDGQHLAFAGVRDDWRDPAGEVLRTFTILTTAANNDTSALRNRLPSIREAADWPVWWGEGGDHLALLQPAPVGVVRMWPVDRAVNSVRINGAELLLPMADAGPQTADEAVVDLTPV